MKNEKDIINRIGEKRFLHSMRVMEEAKKLAVHYGADVLKAEIAGYYHDCAKIRDKNELLKVSKEYGLIFNYDLEGAPEIIHSFLGAIIANRDYGIDDEDILNAIKFHTTGRPNMSLLEKIVFVADIIEPKRNFLGVEEIRELAYVNLDKAVYKGLDNIIKFLMKEDKFIALITIRARNYILK